MYSHAAGRKYRAIASCQNSIHPTSSTEIRPRAEDVATADVSEVRRCRCHVPNPVAVSSCWWTVARSACWNEAPRRMNWNSLMG